MVVKTKVLEPAIDKKGTPRQSHGEGPPPTKIESHFDPGGNGDNGGSGRSSRNAFVAMMLFLGADIMFFAGLLGAFVVYRFGAETWPPPDQPRLPLGVTSLNTLVLLASGIFMVRAWRNLQTTSLKSIRRSIAITLVLGLAFLLIQGYEWARMLEFGLRLSTGVFGATFYTLIGCHALHVIGAVVWLVTVWFRLLRSPQSLMANEFTAVKLVSMYWLLVVVLWPVIFGMVYVS